MTAEYNEGFGKVCVVCGKSQGSFTNKSHRKCSRAKQRARQEILSKAKRELSSGEIGVMVEESVRGLLA